VVELQFIPVNGLVLIVVVTKDVSGVVISLTTLEIDDDWRQRINGSCTTLKATLSKDCNISENNMEKVIRVNKIGE